ncbi:SDR family oxidoreductase [Niabella yanshanensis]|uniref:dTDP-4-dehydrorhamnose reductase n=1 Tax=Niabella yanshanensis TaxID=577386 RepID=A0ABZ0WCB9_9BACT|nr:SDR family oxidoreductase [Niabella yanshanensis]WQD40334.1 SDR family oxidoreductase [Niabella yanshanensis]
MKVFVTGANGFVGSYIVAQLLADGHEVFASSRTGDLSSFNTNKNYRFIQVDFSDPFSLHDAFEFVQPDIVVHSGAMSRPDDCEIKQSDAFDTNVFGTVQLLLNAEAYKSFFIFLSTDFIFDGEKGMYKEEDKPAPVSYYGKTKMDAEEAVMEYRHGWAIVRTSFVYGKPLYGRGNFITMIADKIRTKQPFNVVNDQLRTPTYVSDLANGIAAIVKQRTGGVFNIAGKNILTPFEMAQRVAESLGISDHLIRPVTKDELKELAQRPLKGGLDINKAISDLKYEPVSFDEGLRATLR